MRKTNLESHNISSIQKMDGKKQVIFEKRGDFEKWEKNDHFAKAKAFGKWSVWVKK